MVRPPNTTTSTAVIHNIGDTLPSFHRDTTSAATVATTNTAVATSTLAITSPAS